MHEPHAAKFSEAAEPRRGPTIYYNNYNYDILQ